MLFLVSLFCGLNARDIGLIKHLFNQDTKSRYIIQNSSKAIMKLGKIRTSCTCADVKYLKSELQPGESTELIVTLKANSLSGPFTHTIAQSKNFEKRAALAAIKKISNRRGVIR